MILIVIFLVVMMIMMVLGFVLHRGCGRLMPVNDHEFRRFGSPFYFLGDVDHFPSFPFQLFQVASSPPEECIICRRRYQPHHQLILLPRCGHVYHALCIHSWLAAAGSNQSCPLCRQGVIINDDDHTSVTETSSSDAYTFINSTVATDGSSTSEEEEEVVSSSVSSSATPPEDSFEVDEIVREQVDEGDAGEPDLVRARARGEVGVSGQCDEPYDDDVVQVSCFSRCLGFTGPKKLGAPRERVSGVSHVVGCFSRCLRFIKPKKFRAQGKDGVSGESHVVGLRIFSRCVNLNKPKKS